jgi:hypothetical protein
VDNGKGRSMLGISTQREIVKYCDEENQREIIRIVKEHGRERALREWRLVKREHGIL